MHRDTTPLHAPSLRGGVLAVAFVAAVAAVAAVGARPTTQPAPADRAQPQQRIGDADAEIVAYAIGYFLGDEVRFGLERDGLDVDHERVLRGFTDALGGNEPAIDPATMDDALAAAHNAVQRRVVERRLDDDPEFRLLHDRNLERSNAFHEHFADQPGAVTMPSGAQYRVIERGQGEPAGRDATVVVTFRGALLDGRVFSEGEDVEIALADLTPGVRELLGMMRPGDWWQLAVPPALAYQGLGKPEMGIGPNETLIGDVKLLEVR